jgi:beta-glucanase (GH16 family)
LAVRILLVAGLFGTSASLARAWPVALRPVATWRLVVFDDFSHGLQSSWWGAYSGQPAGDPGGFWSPAHAVVKDGVLNLETYRDPRYGMRWVSAGVSSAPALKQTYGKYQIRLRMDAGKGVGLAMLLWPVRGVWPPEIDFAENGGATNARSTVAAFLHYGARDSQIQRATRIDLTRWHTLGVEWVPGKVLYTVDGRQWASITGRQVPSEPMEMDIQTQAGTCTQSWAPCPDRHTPARVSAQIAWVAEYAYQGPR